MKHWYHHILVSGSPHVPVPEQCEAPAAVLGSLDAVRRFVQLLHQHLLRQEPVSYKKTMIVNIILRIR